MDELKKVRIKHSSIDVSIGNPIVLTMMPLQALSSSVSLEPVLGQDVSHESWVVLFHVCTVIKNRIDLLE